MPTDTKSGMDQIRVRANLAVLDNQGKILLVPHFLENDEVCWYVPGGGVEFGEKLEDAARREFQEETGLKAEISELIDVFEMIEPEKPWHSISLTYKGKVTDGKLKPKNTMNMVIKRNPRWFSKEELTGKSYRPPQAISKLMNIDD